MRELRRHAEMHASRAQKARESVRRKLAGGKKKQATRTRIDFLPDGIALREGVFLALTPRLQAKLAP